MHSLKTYAQPRTASKKGLIGPYRGYSVRHRAYVRCFNQSERGYGVRHGVYVRFSTNQSTGIAYVTGCTCAFRPINARRSRILISVAPCGGLRNLAQPHATSRSLKNPARSVPILLLILCSISKIQRIFSSNKGVLVSNNRF